MNSKLIKVAASGLAISITAVACKPATTAYRPAAASAKSAKGDQIAFAAYNDAQKALAKGKLDTALAAMEQAVAWAPHDAGYRKGLAEMYLKSGRFASAETTFGDVLTLNPGDSRSGFYLALTRIAQGKTSDAIAQLDQMDSNLAPADLGLAYAIAGQTQRALQLLEPAARDHDANGRTRQNLALAYALAGDWKKARITAAQDVSPTDLNKRMAQWAALADPSATAARVAILLGVTPNQEDSGQPAKLALAPVASEPTAVAEAADPAPVAEPVVVAQAEPVAAAPAENTSVTLASTAAEALSVPTRNTVVPAAIEAEAVPAVDNTSVAFETKAAPAVMVPEARARFIRAAQEFVTPEDEARQILPTPIPAFVPARKSKFGGRYVVQIGAFRTSAQVERAWAQAQRRYPMAGGHKPLSTTVRIEGLGVMHRLSVSGFSTQTAAARVCQSIRARSGACFVRPIAGDAPIRWVSRDSRKA